MQSVLPPEGKLNFARVLIRPLERVCVFSSWDNQSLHGMRGRHHGRRPAKSFLPKRIAYGTVRHNYVAYNNIGIGIGIHTGIGIRIPVGIRIIHQYII